jgi:hypothetical protein
MPEKTTYYAIIGVGRAADNPSGLARRRHTGEGRVDESLRRDLGWGPTATIVDWEYGNHTGDLAEITEGEAEALIERFREKWCRLAPGLVRQPVNHAHSRREGKQRVGSTLCVELTPKYGGQSFTKG